MGLSSPSRQEARRAGARAVAARSGSGGELHDLDHAQAGGREQRAAARLPAHRADELPALAAAAGRRAKVPLGHRLGHRAVVYKHLQSMHNRIMHAPRGCLMRNQ